MFFPLLLATVSSASIIPDLVIRNVATPARVNALPQSTVCGDIFTVFNANETHVVFPARQAYDCLISVPFNEDVAIRFLNYFNDTLQFQSTLSYLKDPPSSYQQPAVDILRGLQEIHGNIESGVYNNQYDFEVAVQKLVLAAHDTHLNLAAGVLAVFSFGSQYPIQSVSIDGIQLPKIYITDDLLPASLGVQTEWQPSAISTINGIDSTDYLTGFLAANAFGGLEPHADWNQLLGNPVGDIQGDLTVFGGGAQFFPGDDLVFQHENGTTTNSAWYALYEVLENTGPLTTGGDFYNYFVLGQLPASYPSDLDNSGDGDDSTTDDSSASSSNSSSAVSPLSIGWDEQGFVGWPHADVIQPDLSTSGGGFLTGYFLNGSSTAVLSIPSFLEYGDAVGTFQQTVFDFLGNATAKNQTKLIIDLQENSGGDDLLAVDTFKQLFPQLEPFAGSRKRAHQSADILGQVITAFWNGLQVNSDDYESNSTSEWVSSDLLDAATGQNFSSWTQYYGPNAEHGDFFTSTQRANLSSAIYDDEASGGIVVAGYDINSDIPSQPFSAADIILLTDGNCASSCSLFVELMHHQAGVRTVVVGGRPQTGPMQTAAGTRSASAYDTSALDDDFVLAQSLNPTLGAQLPDRTNNDLFITVAAFSIRDQIRQNEPTPLQFLYEAADCRIFYTPSTVYNLTNLWNYAAEAAWSKPDLCVAGSTGYATGANSTSNAKGPGSSINSTNSGGLDFYNTIGNSISLKVDTRAEGIDDITGRVTGIGKTCKSGKDCGSLLCRSVATCSAGGIIQQKHCVNACNAGYSNTCQGGAANPGPQYCHLDLSSNSGRPIGGALSGKIASGHCELTTVPCAITKVTKLSSGPPKI